MKDLAIRLEKIHRAIEKFLSLQQEQQNKIEYLKAENQQLIMKVQGLERELNKSNEKSATALLINNKNNLQNKQEIGNKIEELLSEVEQCITLMDRGTK